MNELLSQPYPVKHWIIKNFPVCHAGGNGCNASGYESHPNIQKRHLFKLVSVSNNDATSHLGATFSSALSHWQVFNKKKRRRRSGRQTSCRASQHINLQLLVKAKDHRKSIRDTLFFICHCKCRAVQPAVPPIRTLIAI